ncbi:GNAT family N-acetyltransferase [Deinococcus sp.]|uniref:GNAT family N-acetyltransferase n=1 Tax=Deinococcus sp. TaxID=47478 RepID=UPI003CC66D1B
MFELATSRLYLIQTPLHVVEMRLAHETFDAELPIRGQRQSVHFPAEWPGEPLAFFPGMAEHLRRHPDAELWGGILIEQAGMVAVGQIGTKGPPDPAGSVDIGYGINPSYEGRGYMTEAVRGLSAWMLARPEVSRVTADCLNTNIGSVRVLEKSGFVRVGERYDEEEGGTLILWERRA